MYCPNCQQEYDGKFCPECGTELIEKPVQESGVSINLGDANAISGGIHMSDSHDVHQHTVNNQTVYEAQKTAAELIQEREEEFLRAVQERLVDNILDAFELAELNQIAIHLQIPPARAGQLIDQLRNNTIHRSEGEGNAFLAEQLLKELIEAIHKNQVDLLRRRFGRFENIAANSVDGNIQFYYQMLEASFFPEKSVISFINTRADNYWQLFWAHIAYVKLGNIDNAVALLPRLGGFGTPKGDIAFLLAIDNLAEYRIGKQEHDRLQAKQYLEEARQKGMSEYLQSIWPSVRCLLNETEESRDGSFILDVTLRELVHTPAKESLPPTDFPIPAPPPPVPKFNAQSVVLNQMQGFNPLQAAKRLNIGIIPSAGITQDSQQGTLQDIPPFPDNDINKQSNT